MHNHAQQRIRVSLPLPSLRPLQVGERLGVGVTLVLTIEISRGSAQAVLPVCGELLCQMPHVSNALNS